MADNYNGKVLRVLSIIQCVFGGLFAILFIAEILLATIWTSLIAEVLLAIVVSFLKLF